MELAEAFRICLGSRKQPRHVDEYLQRTQRFKHAVDKILEPLRLAERRHFFSYCDGSDRLMEWLIVKIEPSGQLPLLEEIANRVHDQELERECQQALGLAQRALQTLRELAKVAKLTPNDFYKILQGKFPEPALPLLALSRTSQRDAGPVREVTGTARAQHGVLIRGPDGMDLFSEFPSPISRHTGHQAFEHTFRVDSIQRGDKARVRLLGTEHNGKRNGIPVWLHWERRDRTNIVDALADCLKENETICIKVRRTGSVGNAAGAMRFEYVSIAGRDSGVAVAEDGNSENLAPLTITVRLDQ